ncbi:MAG: LamB/YcsF family protein [Actinomycetota bacterium]|nr:LamB/YcsF family protein [Actinomycetota bacterium]
MPTDPDRTAQALIDLNADVGEAVTPGGDSALLRVVTSASVACGFHAGDPHLMRVTCAAAAREGVRLGAHVSYGDREGFGRRELDVPAARVADDLVYQVGALMACARAEGAAARYVKLHGALYGRANRDAELALALAMAISAVAPMLELMTPPDSALATAAAQRGLGVIAEGFADRGYAADGTLLPRSQAAAVLASAAAAEQAVRLATRGSVGVTGGGSFALQVRSLCIHSDTPGALEVAIAVRDALVAAGVRIVAGS